MRDETEKAENELRAAVEELDYELSGFSVYEWEDGADISLDVTVGESRNENPFRVK